ncbi:MAG: glycyl-radical enzyme activating protein [Bacteroidetes bacterium]|nr:MAG: glycyl-radical enzyme activating protein [Bacteroidota bacterium]
MTGIVFDIKRFAIHDGPGIRTSIFFKGCPLSCWWCHNPESIRAGVEQLNFKFKGKNYIGWETTSENLLIEAEKDRPFYEQSNGGITFTGGEPLMQSDFLMETTKLFKQHNLHICLDTSGFASSKFFQEISQYIDLFLFDLKHLDNKMHKKYTSVSNQVILKNLEYLVKIKKEVHIRFPFIPTINNQSGHLKDMANYLNNLKHIKNINILPFHKIAQGKYEQLNFENKMSEIQEPSNEEIENAKFFFEKQGFNVKIGG